LRDVDFVHVEAAVRVAREGTTGNRATLPGGLALIVGYDVLTIAAAGYEPPPEGPALPAGTELPVVLPGVTPLPGGKWRLKASFLETWTAAAVEGNPDRWTAYLDAESVRGLLFLRTRRPGDRFRPQGLAGHAPRLTDWMINAKIPRAWRDSLPLLVAGDGEILWVCGWRVAETVAIRPTTRRVIRFQFIVENP
jgi:tRNA(Ile)-lysidine synthase